MTLFLPLAIAVSSPSRAAPQSENEALHECHRYPADKRFVWKLRGQVDLPTLVNAIAPMLCRPVIIPGSLRPMKVTLLAPATLTAAEAYRMFLSSLETMGLTIEPEGKVLKVIDSRSARQTAIPTYTGDVPARDQFVTRLLHLDNVTADEVKPVLDRLRGRDADITSYAPTNTLVITDLASNVRRMAEVARQLDTPLGGQHVFTLEMRHVPVGEIATMLQAIFTTKQAPPPRRFGRPTPPKTSLDVLGPDLAVSQILPYEASNLLVIVASENAFERMRALVQRLDQAAEGATGSDLVHVVRLENAIADEMIGTLAGIGVTTSRGGASTASSRRGFQPRGAPAPPPGPFQGELRVLPDKATNSLIVMALAPDFIMLRDLIKKLDIPRRQVFIEADILEVSLDRSRTLGTAWHGGSTIDTGGQQSLLFGGSEPSSDVNSILFSPAALSGLAAGLRGPAIPGADKILGLPPGTSVPSFGVFLQLLQNSGDVNVVSMPHLLTTDNEKATIQVGQNLPFPGSLGGFPTAGGVGALPGATFGFGTSVQRQDVALKLEITPHVNDSDFVRLEVSNELSDVANPNYNGLGPATSKRTVKSVVTVRDQQSIVLGGLMKDSVSSTVAEVPVLGEIPIIGYLFKSTKKTMTKQNLLLVLTPYIVKDPSDLRRIFERKLRERREFLERYSSFRDTRDYEADIDYHRNRGLLEEINRAAIEAADDAAALRAAERKMAHSIDGPVDPPTAIPRNRARPRNAGG